MNSTPLISVIMPVYNATPFLKKAIESILTQSYIHFEFLIVDDASKDTSWNMLQTYKKTDARITLYKNKKHVGPAASVNKLIKKSSGEFIARMDADDISLPDRLQKQLHFLSTNTDVLAVGGQFFIINEKDEVKATRVLPLDHASIYRYAFQFTPVFQPAIMIAKNRLPKNFNYYTNTITTAEEVELLFKLLSLGKLANLTTPVLFYRIHGKNTSLKNVKLTFFNTLIARVNAVKKYSYKPNLTGIVITVIQTILVFLLPQGLIVYLHEKLRNTPLRSKYAFHSLL